MKIVRFLASLLAAGAVLASAALNVYAESGDTAVSEAVQTETPAAGIAGFGSGGGSYYSVLYDSTSGLPTSEANTILQTSDGFVWIGSYSGLIRYDGNEFYRYDSSYGVPNVVSLFEDSRQRLWIGTNDSGVVLYEKGVFTAYDNIEGLKSSSIRAIAEDASGNIIIATKLGIGYVSPDNSMHILDDPQLNAEDVRELKMDSSGVIFGHTNTGSFFTMEDLHTTSFYNGNTLGIGAVSGVCPDNNNSGWVYLGTSQSEVIHGDLANGMTNYTVTDVSPLVNINELCSINGDIWVCADNGIGCIGTNGDFVLLDHVPMNNSIDDMMYDYEGNLWFASSRQGIMKVASSDFTDINLSAGLEDMVVNTTCINGNDLYIGTDTGLYVLDAKTYEKKKNEMTELLSNVRIRCIKNDSEGNIWFSTYSGLICRKTDGSIITFNEDNGLGSNKVRVSEELSDGRIAVSTNAGLYFIRDFRIEGSLSSDSGLAKVEILTICEGEDGRILLGSNGSGLYIVDGNNVTRIGRNSDHTSAEGLKSDVIMRIKKDESTGIYWIITSSSLSYMRGSEVTTITAFPYSNNFDIFFDGKGSAWIFSSNGLYVTTVEALIRNSDIAYTFYDTSCGLPSVATANSRSFMSEDGNIYISGSKGVSVVNINSLRNSTADIRLTIPFVEVDGRLIGVDESGTLTIPADSQRITIYGYALTYSLVNPKLSYMLTGFDTEPMTAMRQDMKPVSYTNLSGGIYSFRLSQVDPLTGQAEKTVELTLIKEKALWEQYWFQVTAIVAAGVFVFLLFEFIHRKRESALIKEQERKQLMIDEIIQAFAKLIDMKDKYTNGHSFRVAEYSKLIAQKRGLSDYEAKQVYNVALLHDIGKISIPDRVLNKPDKPTDEEYEILKTHAQNGYEVLKEITIYPELAYGAGYHHERLDGKGYPNGLKGEEIPDVAQIIAVADTFDAMYSTRPYRKQMDVHVVLEELKRVSGTQLNGEYVNCLVELVEEGAIGQREL